MLLTALVWMIITSIRIKAWNLTSKAFSSRYVITKSHWTALTQLNFKILNLTALFVTALLGLSSIRVGAWKLTGRALPSTYINIEIRWTAMTQLKFNIPNLTGRCCLTAVCLGATSIRIEASKLTGAALWSTYINIKSTEQRSCNS